MSPHLYAVTGGKDWPPEELHRLGAQIQVAATTVMNCKRLPRHEVADALALIVTTASRAEVLVRRREPLDGGPAA